MMGLDELLASDFDSYVELAVRLARDATWRNALRERMLLWASAAAATAC